MQLLQQLSIYANSPVVSRAKIATFELSTDREISLTEAIGWLKTSKLPDYVISGHYENCELAICSGFSTVSHVVQTVGSRRFWVKREPVTPELGTDFSDGRE